MLLDIVRLRTRFRTFAAESNDYPPPITRNIRAVDLNIQVGPGTPEPHLTSAKQRGDFGDCDDCDEFFLWRDSRSGDCGRVLTTSERDRSSAVLTSPEALAAISECERATFHGHGTPFNGHGLTRDGRGTAFNGHRTSRDGHGMSFNAHQTTFHTHGTPCD